MSELKTQNIVITLIFSLISAVLSRRQSWRLRQMFQSADELQRRTAQESGV